MEKMKKLVYKLITTAIVAAVSSLQGYSQDLANFTEQLAGKYPGLVVIDNDGTPGHGSARMMIRGIGSYASSTDVNTLKIYVDGFEVKSDFINYISAEEIESVSILKDAAQLAIYGMNGANGVIFITTKRGAESAPVITFKTRGGVQFPVNVAKPMGALDYSQLYNQAWSNDHGREWDPFYDFEVIGELKNGNGTDVSWYDEVLGRPGMSADATLSIRGGSDRAKYSVLLDYANQQGFLKVKNTDRTHNVSFAKYGVRTNLDMKLNKVLSVSVDLGGRLEDRTRPNYSLYSLMEDVMSYPANIYPVLDPLSTDPISSFSGTATHPNNPVASVTGLGWTTSRTKVMQANFKFRENLDFLLPGLYLQEGFSFYSKTIGNTAKTRTYARYYGGVAQTSDVSTYLRSNGYWSSGKERWMQGNVIMGWDGEFGNNRIGTSVQAHLSDFNGNGSESYNWKYRYINYSGDVRYSYANRYETALAFSLFGSDAYAPGRRYGFYPSLSLGWVASNEDFLKGNQTLNYLKFRASAGLSGSTDAYVGIDGFQTEGRYLYQQYYTWTGSFVTGMGPGFDGGSSGIRPLFKGNPDVRPEKSLKVDAGLDVRLWEHLSLSASYFVDLRSDILTLDRTLMDYNGVQTYYSNIGKMINQGVDATLTYSGRKGGFEYSVFANVLYTRNKILEMGEVGNKYSYNAATGHPYGSRMGLECIGFYDVKDFDLDGELNMGLPVPLFGEVQPGDLRYKDQDGDGYIDDTDIVFLGNPSYPSLYASLGAELNWRGFDFSLLVTASAGGTLNLMDYSAWKPFMNYGTVFEWASNAWAYYPEAQLDTRETATFPRLTTRQNDNNYRTSSFWIKKNDFLRLSHVELGYTVKKFRVYVSGQNLFTLSSLLTKYKMDPETVNYGYPAAMSVNLGVQVSF